MEISRELIEHVANLARLELDGAEVDSFTRQIGGIISYVDKLNSLDTSEVEPTSHALHSSNVFREDLPAGSLPRDEVLANAPESTGEFYRVPRIIE